MKEILPKEVKIILDKLKENGFQGYVVGGAVRNYLLGKTPKDWDICTNAFPSQIQEIFKEYRQIDAGLKHGTVSIIIDNKVFEITTFRKDGTYTDGRHPDTVTFIDDLKEDLARRDFTINAMAYSEEHGIIDFFGGKQDLKKKLIKCVGDPMQRFEEDGLRILRAIRFATQLNFSIEEKTKSALLYKTHLLKSLSQERKTEEIIKILSYPNGIEKIMEFELTFTGLFRGLSLSNTIRPSDYFPATNLAILLRKNVKELVKQELKNMKFSNHIINLVTQSIEAYQLYEKAPEKNKILVKNLLNKFDREIVTNIFYIKMAQENYDSKEFLTYSKFLREIDSNREPYKVAHLAINGIDLKNLGFEGKEISKNLDKILGVCINDSRLNNRKTLLELLGKNFS